MSFPQYGSYRNSGFEWLGEIPSHWGVDPVKRLCDVRPSNIDKKSYDDERPVKLCNYTDVYYRDHIVAELDFMEATASEAQISRFSLRSGDVVITKDSETADDIAIAAYVPYDLPGVVCGYHLALLRPGHGTFGACIKWFFDSHLAKAQAATRANGLTRVGLSQYALDNLIVPAPPPDEQAAISSFLDRETAKIDALVAEQQRLIALLKEKRQAAISHVVTKGLDPSTPMKDSGVEWLGEIPAHWDVLPLKRVWSVADCKHVTAEFVDEGYPLASIREVQARYVELSEAKRTTEDFYHQLIEGARRPEPGDLIFSRNATVGEVAEVAEWHPPFAMGQDVCLLRRFRSTMSSGFFRAALQSAFVREQLDRIMVGATFKRVNVEDIRNLMVVAPPDSEQTEIAARLEDLDAQLNGLIKEAELGQRLLSERRTALISAAVTGKIDVRASGGAINQAAKKHQAA